MIQFKRLANKMAVEPWRWWTVLFVTLIPVVFYEHGSQADLEKSIRWHAATLQLLGLFLVGKGLSDTADRFGRLSPLGSLKRWFRSFSRANRVTTTVNMSMGAFAVSGVGLVLKVNRGSPTVEQRLEDLELGAAEVQRELKEIREGHAARFDDVHKRLDSERTAREEAHGKTMDLIDRQIAGGLAEGYMGLAWVFFGTVLGGLTPEFAKLL